MSTTVETAADKAQAPRREIIYVVEGSLEYRLDGEPPVTVDGEAFFVAAEAVHAVKNVGSGNAAELATYASERDKPLIVIAESRNG